MVRGHALTETEQHILLRAAYGETAGETATILYRSPETIKSQRKLIIAKLGARNLTNAVAIGIGVGLVNVERVLQANEAYHGLHDQGLQSRPESTK